MKYINIEAVLADLEAARQREPNGSMPIASVIELLDRYPKIEFDLKDRKDKAWWVKEADNEH